MEYGKKQTARAVAMAVLASFLLAAAAPSKAAEAPPRLMEPRPTLAAAASEKVESLSNESLAVAAVQAAAPTQAADSGGFFKSGKGKAALVMLIAATGFTVYSKYNDRVKSVIR